MVWHLREKRAWESYWGEAERRRAKREDAARKGPGYQGPKHLARFYEPPFQQG